jgi:hypothetical protein
VFQRFIDLGDQFALAVPGPQFQGAALLVVGHIGEIPLLPFGAAQVGAIFNQETDQAIPPGRVF